MMNDERDELVLELSRSLWSLHMARHYVGKMDYEIKSLNLASAPRSTEIVSSHGHATSMEELDGTVVPNTEVDLAEGQFGQSIQDTNVIENEAIINEVEVKDSVQDEMLESIETCSPPMGTLDVPFLDDSSDLGSLMNQGANGLRDGDLATADLQPGHPIINERDRRMMMTIRELEHARNTLGIEPRCQVLW